MISSSLHWMIWIDSSRAFCCLLKSVSIFLKYSCSSLYLCSITSYFSSILTPNSLTNSSFSCSSLVSITILSFISIIWFWLVWKVHWGREVRVSEFWCFRGLIAWGFISDGCSHWVVVLWGWWIGWPHSSSCRAATPPSVHSFYIAPSMLQSKVCIINQVDEQWASPDILHELLGLHILGRLSF